MDSMPATYVLWFGSYENPQEFQHPYHLGTQLKLAKELARERFNSPRYQQYDRCSLYLKGEYVYGLGRNEDNEEGYKLNSERERFNSDC